MSDLDKNIWQFPEKDDRDKSKQEIIIEEVEETLDVFGGLFLNLYHRADEEEQKKILEFIQEKYPHLIVDGEVKQNLD